MTEAKRFVVEERLLKRALALYGHAVPDAKWYLERAYLPLEYREKQLHTSALLSVLFEIEAEPVRARLGYPHPGWTPQEAIREGKLVLVNGARMINQRYAQAYLFTQIFSLIMAEINRRTPADPSDAPVSLVMDEVYSLLSIPGFAREVGRLSPQYRSRKLQLYIVLQSLSQLARGTGGQGGLREQVWSLGNVLCFRLPNFEEAYELAQQLFPYNPRTTKAIMFSQQPIAEGERGQYTRIANWIQQLAFRQCILRRYTSEQKLDGRIIHTSRTLPVQIGVSAEPLEQIKLRLLKARAVTVKDATRRIRERTLQGPESKPRTV